MVCELLPYRLLVVVFGFLCVPMAHGETLVYLLGGQSNMFGVAPTAELASPLSEPQSDVRYWNNGWVELRPGLMGFPEFFGPEVSFGRAMAEARPNDDIYLVKHAAGGTNLAEQWAPPNGPQYSTFKNNVDAALANLDQAGIDYRVAGMLWMQGESDALNGAFAAEYETNLRNFISQVRSDVGVPALPFVLGRVLTFFDTTPPGGAATVRAAQQSVAESGEFVYWFSTDDMGVGTPDPGHYNATGQIEMGQRFAETLLSLPEEEGPHATYVYNNAAELNEIVGVDLNGDAAHQALTDRVGKAGRYVPTATFWAPGQLGTVYAEDNAGIQSGQPQPSISFDLGGEYELSEVVIHYGVLVRSAVMAPVAVEIEIDSVPVGVFDGFDDSDNVSSFGDIRANKIDLSGHRGQTIEMRFLGGVNTNPRLGSVSLLGLTEVEFKGHLVPEPPTSICGLAFVTALIGIRTRL